MNADGQIYFDADSPEEDVERLRRSFEELEKQYREGIQTRCAEVARLEHEHV